MSPQAAIRFLAVAFAAAPVALQSAPALNARVTWVGNSFSGASNRWVQNFFIHTGVDPDGTVNTWSHWDEGGRKFGQYRDGDVVGNTNQNPNSLQTRDRNGRLWTLNVRYTDPKHQEWEFVPEGISCDGKPVRFPELFQPMALALANDGSLMVADSGIGPRQQVLFYDITDADRPRLVREFGDRGGIRSGTPGQILPTKFWGIRGLGMDAAGNLYVAMSEQGSVLRSFKPDGMLRWEVHGEFFCDVAVADPADDAATVWGIQERYAMDWNQPPGRDARWVAYTLDRHRYPNDPRGLMHVKQQGEHGLTSPQVVYLQGRRFLFVGGMFASNFINIFRFDGEIAVPSGLILQWGNALYNTDLAWPPHKPAGTSIWRDLNGDGDYQSAEYTPNTDRVKPGPFWVDQKGNLWMAYGFFRYDFQGLDAQGNPIYSADRITHLEKPEGVNRVARVCYLDDTDTLVVAEEGEDMRHIRRVFICPGYQAGRRKTVSFVPPAGSETSCVTVAGDYVFTGGWKERGRIGVNRIQDGAEVGVLDPGPTVGGVENTGWIDLLTGISAYRRRDGEYLVFVEENYKAKCLIYRWKP
ncbi:MAG: hypothetical protein JNL10_05980 [Verrucomicrobiales bacterium]|nr:hypothetical protein [Verrucomicrobiales bacterium]